MGNLVQRAQRYEALTPSERAILKLAEGLICSAVVAALPVIAQALGQGGVHWSDALHTALAAASVAALLALSKYAKAHGDPPPAAASTGAEHLTLAPSVSIAPAASMSSVSLVADGLSDLAGDGIDMPH